MSEKAYVVTTDKSGVFFGYASDPDVNGTIELRQARMCVRWSTNVRGVVGLAATGPTKSCRVTKAAPSIELNGVTAVMECSAEAIEAWEQGPWDD